MLNLSIFDILCCVLLLTNDDDDGKDDDVALWTGIEEKKTTQDENDTTESDCVSCSVQSSVYLYLMNDSPRGILSFRCRCRCSRAALFFAR